jgi:enoyl-[acyl-carrier-protein] reductase (NADH)
LEETGFVDVSYPVQDPSAIANCVLFLSSPLASSVNAHSLVADYGYSAKSNFPA